MSKCEHKMVRKFALESEKSMHSLCPTDKTHKYCLLSKMKNLNGHEQVGTHLSPQKGNPQLSSWLVIDLFILEKNSPLVGWMDHKNYRPSTLPKLHHIVERERENFSIATNRKYGKVTVSFSIYLLLILAEFSMWLSSDGNYHLNQKYMGMRYRTTLNMIFSVIWKFMSLW